MTTVAGQLVDTTVLILIAFGGRESWLTMLNLIISGHAGKVLCEAPATPLTDLVVNKLKRAKESMFSIGAQISICSRAITARKSRPR